MFDQMTERDEVAVWNVMITSLKEGGNNGSSTELFWEMHKRGVRHERFGYAIVLSMC